MYKMIMNERAEERREKRDGQRGKDMGVHMCAWRRTCADMTVAFQPYFLNKPRLFLITSLVRPCAGLATETLHGGGKE